MADGTLTIYTETDEKGIKVGMKEIEASVKRMSSSVEGLGEKAKIALQKQLDSISKLNNQYGQQEQKVEALRKRLKELSNQKSETEEYKKLGHELQNAERKLDSFYGKVTKIESQEGMIGKGAFEKMQKEYEQKQLQVQNARIARDTVPKDSEYYDFLKVKYTREYNQQKTELDDLEQRIIEVARTREKVLNSSDYQKAEAEIKRINEEVETMRNTLEDMRNAGTAYVDPRSLSEYQSTASRLTVEEMRLDDMNNRLNTSFATTEMKLKECGEEAARSSSKFSGLAESARRFAEKLKQSGITGMKQKLHELWQALDKLMSKFMQLASGAIVGGLQKISSGIFGIHKSANKSTLSLKNLMKYAFGIRTLFALFNKIRSAATEGIQNLAQHDLLTNTGKVNQSLSELQSALTQLKNSFATAFAPILTTVSPILVSFINLISQAVTRVGMLIAALTGQKTFVKAIAVQENYAASLDKTANSAKKAAKALQGYLSPIDEINRYDDGSSSDSGTGSGGGYTGPSAGDMFEEVPIESSLKGIADKIKELIQNEDWEGLGAYIADGINKGLQKIYNVINWDNVGPEVTRFITAFTTTFNSLVNHINWDLMGRTLGAGVNTLVNSLNLLIGNGGIDFNKIGSSIAKGLRGAIREINWTSLGELLGNKFMISWRMLSGFVNEMSRKNDAGITGWTELGKAVGKAMTGIFSKISFTDIAKALVGVINGAFETLAGFDNEFDWKSFQENLKSGIQTMVNDIDWKGNGKAFGDFLSHLCDCITAAIDNGTFQKLGEGIGEFLAELPWGKLLKTAASALIDGLGGALDGLWRSSLAGKITAGLIVAFGAVKVAQITGLDHLAAYLIGRLATKIISTENTAALTDGVETVLGNALKGATGAASDFAAALGPLVGTAGLIIAVGGAATVATSELAGFVETMQGGNGIGSTFGNTMNNFIQTLQHRGDIISGSAEEIWQLKESLEQEGMTAEDKASATQKLIDKLGEMGVTSDQAEQAFSTLYQQGLITDDMFDILSESIKTLGDNTTNMAGSIDLSKQSLDDLYDNVLPQLQTQLGLSADEMVQLDTALLEAENSGGTAQDAFNRIMERAKELGINTESVAKIFAEVFPDAVREAESSTKTSMDNTKKSVETGMGAASVAAGAAMAGIQKSTEDSMSAAERAVSDSTGNISKDSDANWGASKGYATDALGKIDQEAYDTMQRVDGVVKRWNKDIKGDFDTNWGDSKNTVVGAVQGMADEIERNGDRLASGVKNAFSGIPNYIKDIMNNAVGKVNSAINNANSALGGIERSFTFTYNYTNPFNNRKSTYHSYLNLNRANTVPYLASGAVIPPRSEFLAVLGDQKNGRNLEAPEDLLRQIVREETGGKQGNNTYNVSVSASGRNLLDIVLEEGELRRNRNGGRNPFKLDD